MLFRTLVLIQLLLPLLIYAQLPKPANIAFIPGEELNYTVHYGFVNAAKIRLQVGTELQKFGNKYHYYYYAQGITNTGWDYFFKVRDYYYSYVDTASLLPISAIRNVAEGDYSRTENFLFKRNEGIVVSENTDHKAPADLMDLLAAVYYARCIDYSKVGINKEIPFNTFFENDLFPVGLTLEGKATVDTKFGKINCLILRPKLVEGRIFKGQKDMAIYVSDDKNHLPVKVRTAIFVGYIEADLTSYKNLKHPIVFINN